MARPAGLGYRLPWWLSGILWPSCWDGVDSSPDMLARARRQVPGAGFLAGDVHALPVAEATMDLVVCALALTHVRALSPALAIIWHFQRLGD